MKQAQSQIKNIEEQVQLMERDGEIETLHSSYAKAQQEIFNLKEEAKLNNRIIQLMSEEIDSKEYSKQ